MRQIGDFVDLPSGHTSSCIQDCKYIWTGGPARRSDQLWLGPILSPTAPAPYTFTRLVGDGRPIWVTDLTNPARPEVSDQPVDIWRNDGYTDYSHDVDEDEEGIAWVSGRGGIRGYATDGYAPRPVPEPLPQGHAVRADPGRRRRRRRHGPARDADAQLRPSDRRLGPRLRHQARQRARRHRGGVHAALRGRAARSCFSDLTDSWGGEPASKSSLTAPYRMKALDTFHPFIDTPETANPAAGCSAHYFEIEGSTLGAGWYGQGLRLLDISNARDVRQVGYYRVTGTGTDNPSSNSWDMAFKSERRKGDLVYLFDMSRGVEILRMKKGAHHSKRR